MKASITGTGCTVGRVVGDEVSTRERSPNAG